MATTALAMIVFFSLALAIPAISAAAPPPSIVNTNHTVGDKAGWFFNTKSNAPSGNYSDWAASQTFYLGDYLIFNTDTNSSNIVQTNNETTYTICDASNDDGNQTFLWGNDGSDSNSSAPTPQVVEIALVYEGLNYFFSDAMDGEQCQKGMKFYIKVLHGNGLPASLSQPPPPPYAKPPAPATATEGGNGTASENQSSAKNGVDVIRGGVVWVGLGMFSMVLLAL